jgi:hypothetical protein
MDKFTDRVVRKFKKHDKKYNQMTPEEKYNYVSQLLESFSPNEEIRNKKK